MRSGKNSKRKLKPAQGYDGIPEGDMRLIADVIGPDAARMLMLKLGKMNFYIPQPSEFREWYVRTHFTGKNYQELAFELGVSPRTVHEYVRKMYSRPAGDEPRQGTLFGI